MLSRAVRPTLAASRRNIGTQFKGEFGTYPPKKVYWGKGNFSGEALIAVGFVAFLATMANNVGCDYVYNSYCLSSSHYNMDNIIVVDGKYRWIPSRMRPPQHADGGYGYQDIEQDWTPTDGKGI